MEYRDIADLKYKMSDLEKKINLLINLVKEINKKLEEEK